MSISSIFLFTFEGGWGGQRGAPEFGRHAIHLKGERASSRLSTLRREFCPFFILRGFFGLFFAVQKGYIFSLERPLDARSRYIVIVMVILHIFFLKKRTTKYPPLALPPCSSSGDFFSFLLFYLI